MRDKRSSHKLCTSRQQPDIPMFRCILKCNCLCVVYHPWWPLVSSSTAKWLYVC